MDDPSLAGDMVDDWVGLALGDFEEDCGGQEDVNDVSDRSHAEVNDCASIVLEADDVFDTEPVDGSTNEAALLQKVRAQVAESFADSVFQESLRASGPALACLADLTSRTQCRAAVLAESLETIPAPSLVAHMDEEATDQEMLAFGQGVLACAARSPKKQPFACKPSAMDLLLAEFTDVLSDEASADWLVREIEESMFALTSRTCTAMGGVSPRVHQKPTTVTTSTVPADLKMIMSPLSLGSSLSSLGGTWLAAPPRAAAVAAAPPRRNFSSHEQVAARMALVAEQEALAPRSTAERLVHLVEKTQARTSDLAEQVERAEQISRSEPRAADKEQDGDAVEDAEMLDFARGVFTRTARTARFSQQAAAGTLDLVLAELTDVMTDLPSSDWVIQEIQESIMNLSIQTRARSSALFFSACGVEPPERSETSKTNPTPARSWAAGGPTAMKMLLAPQALGALAHLEQSWILAPAPQSISAEIMTSDLPSTLQAVQSQAGEDELQGAPIVPRPPAGSAVGRVSSRRRHVPMGTPPRAPFAEEAPSPSARPTLPRPPSGADGRRPKSGRSSRHLSHDGRTETRAAGAAVSAMEMDLGAGPAAPAGRALLPLQFRAGSLDAPRVMKFRQGGGLMPVASTKAPSFLPALPPSHRNAAEPFAWGRGGLA